MNTIGTQLRDPMKNLRPTRWPMYGVINKWTLLDMSILLEGVESSHIPVGVRII